MAGHDEITNEIRPRSCLCLRHYFTGILPYHDARCILVSYFLHCCISSTTELPWSLTLVAVDMFVTVSPDDYVQSSASCHLGSRTHRHCWRWSTTQAMLVLTLYRSCSTLKNKYTRLQSKAVEVTVQESTRHKTHLSSQGPQVLDHIRPASPLSS
jgi:hypothetical protein